MDVIASMHENANFDDIIRTLDIIRRNEKAMDDIHDGRVYNTNEAMNLVRDRAARL